MYDEAKYHASRYFPKTKGKKPLFVPINSYTVRLTCPFKFWGKVIHSVFDS